jgi:hypothetical protein
MGGKEIADALSERLVIHGLKVEYLSCSRKFRCESMVVGELGVVGGKTVFSLKENLGQQTPRNGDVLNAIERAASAFSKKVDWSSRVL